VIEKPAVQGAGRKAAERILAALDALPGQLGEEVASALIFDNETTWAVIGEAYLFPRFRPELPDHLIFNIWCGDAALVADRLSATDPPWAEIKAALVELERVFVSETGFRIWCRHRNREHGRWNFDCRDGEN
jgi:hypothetical protein